MCRYIHVYYRLCPHTHSKYTPISVCPRAKERLKVCSWETARLGIGIETGLAQVVEEKGSCDGCARGARKIRERVREQMVGMGIRRGRSYVGKGKGVENAETEVQRHEDDPKMLGTRSEGRYDGREHHDSSSLDIPAGWCDLGLEM